ncbi:MAG: nucleotide sugar dehydrogenase [Chloroflexi bacterium]|nr:nucleotide sugar dehydrogenase [Chloroflexota bacterium]MBT7079971.1 nucleotide sugar dehydrogenase [Chloroflexota bacterium]MBT7289499.1 nucleotide sugar dehydrogenase [Chloroflexota bacterium]
MKKSLESEINNKSAIIAIVGLGYVGLPLTVAFAEAGYKVLGIDVQQARADLVNSGKSYIADVNGERLAKVVANGLIEATTDQSRLKEADAICICVPTPLTKTKDPDLSYVTYEAEQIQETLRPGQLIVLESTTYPGTTKEVILPILLQSGLKEGSDFYLAYSPERVDPNNQKYNIKNTPKVVGGISSTSTKLATLLYSQIADNVVDVSSPETAEMTKVFENVFRSVNIALVNELAQLCEKMGISVWEVIKAASTKPYGYTPFYPGPGIGGHCIPLDPYYLANKARELDFHTRFIELASDINEHMPYHVIERIMDALNSAGKSLKGAKVLVLGVAYKKDIEDIRESPALKLLELLCAKETDVSFNDPYINEVKLTHVALTSTELSSKILSAADCVVIATDHSCYDIKDIAAQAKLVFDTRGVTTEIRSENIHRLGE